MLTHHQKETFAQKGVIRLEKFLPVEQVTSVQQSLFRVAEKSGYWHEGVWQLNRMPSQPKFTNRKYRTVFNDLITDELLDTISSLVAGQPISPMADPSLLFSLPEKKSWTLPTAWHVDVPRIRHRGIPGVQIFTFLDTVVPRGGGTLIISGSHHLKSGGKFIRSRELRSMLETYPYFQALVSNNQPDRERYFTTPREVEGVALQVLELHGEPGDVYFIDIRTLHTRSDNTARVPRVMLTQRYCLESVCNQFQSPRKLRKRSK